MSLLNDTTRVSADNTVGDIPNCLATHGATAILSAYDDQGHVIALSCQVSIGQQGLAFRLSSDWRPVLTLLEHDRTVPRNLRTYEQAIRVSWRMMVFLPYAIMRDGRTLYERVRDARCVLPPAETQEASPVAQQPLTIAFEDVPLDEARRMSRGPRMDPELYQGIGKELCKIPDTPTTGFETMVDRVGV